MSDVASGAGDRVRDALSRRQGRVEASFEGLRELARRAILIQPHAVHSPAIIGSVARGWSSATSDVDVACFVEDEAPPDFHVRFEGVDCSFIYFNTTDLQDALAPRQQNLINLRLASAFETARPLFQATPYLDLLRARNRVCTFDSRIRDFCSDIAVDGLRKVSQCDTVYKLVLRLNRSIQAALVVLLASTPIRVIKPKWTMLSLRLVDHGIYRSVAKFLQGPLIEPISEPSACARFLKECFDPSRGYERERLKTISDLTGGPSSVLLDADLRLVGLAASLALGDEAEITKSWSSLRLPDLLGADLQIVCDEARSIVRESLLLAKEFQE